LSLNSITAAQNRLQNCDAVSVPETLMNYTGHKDWFIKASSENLLLSKSVIDQDNAKEKVAKCLGKYSYISSLINSNKITKRLVMHKKQKASQQWNWSS